ncbi:hypothetical protein [Prosthecobacter fluviatilis]|uniref:Uncharacterized protein n=1 Tax=Prosthecobacter fluviatilis TaxID=445931 RepID=A0ABW0KTB3_9BACT
MPTNGKLQIFVDAAQSCAMQMLGNATYIQAEMPSLTLPEGMREQLGTLCDRLTATKHDVISELFELSQASESSTPTAEIKMRVARITQWLWETMLEMNEVVQSLQTASEADTQFFGSWLLVVESAPHILEPFNRTSEAADALLLSEP